MALLVSNIRTLVHTQTEQGKVICGEEMDLLKSVDDAFLLIESGKITGFGKSGKDVLTDIRRNHASLEELDAEGGHVFPAWCDAHTHTV
ncbi:MAG: imidazolonepropionase, partial [Bacteroidota bacterium]